MKTPLEIEILYLLTNKKGVIKVEEIHNLHLDFSKGHTFFLGGKLSWKFYKHWIYFNGLLVMYIVY